MFKIVNKNSLDWLITILILLITDNPILYSNRNFKAGVFVFLFILFILNRRKKFDLSLLYFVASVIIIILLQGLRWGYSWFTTGTYVGLAILTPYFALKLVGIKYLDITSKIVYIIAVYSTVLYFAQLFVPGFTNILLGLSIFFQNTNDIISHPSILIYTIANQFVEQGSMAGILRNAGMFHEPGAFAVFIDLAITINILKTGKLFTKKNIIMLIALATTFSTAGILAFLLIMGVYYFILKKNDPIKFFLILTITIPVFIGIWQLPFVKNKIEYQFKDQTTASLNTATSGRILGARKAIYVLTKYPVTGRGLIISSRVESFHSAEKAGYGYMNYFSQLGVIFSIVFIILFIKGMKRISYYYTGYSKPWLLLGAGLIINLFSQKFIADSFFTMFLFIGLLNEFSFNNIKVYFQNNANE